MVNTGSKSNTYLVCIIYYRQMPQTQTSKQSKHSWQWGRLKIREVLIYVVTMELIQIDWYQVCRKINFYHQMLYVLKVIWVVFTGFMLRHPIEKKKTYVENCIRWGIHKRSQVYGVSFLIFRYVKFLKLY